VARPRRLHRPLYGLRPRRHLHLPHRARGAG
jgi:hypothetical protein